MADVSQGHFSRIAAAVINRIYAGVRKSSGRVWFGSVHLRQHADENGNCPSSYHDEAGAVRLRRCDSDCLGHAGHLLFDASCHQLLAVANESAYDDGIREEEE